MKKVVILMTLPLFSSIIFATKPLKLEVISQAQKICFTAPPKKTLSQIKAIVATRLASHGIHNEPILLGKENQILPNDANLQELITSNLLDKNKKSKRYILFVQ